MLISSRTVVNKKEGILHPLVIRQSLSDPHQLESYHPKNPLHHHDKKQTNQNSFGKRGNRI